MKEYEVYYNQKPQLYTLTDAINSMIAIEKMMQSLCQDIKEIKENLVPSQIKEPK